MGLYGRYVLPLLVDLGCGAKPVDRQRRKVVPLAEGRVLEVGFGTGLNLPHYDADRVSRVYGLDPGKGMLARARDRSAGLGFEVEHLPLSGEQLPLDDDSVDTVVITYTLCTIPDALAALAEMHRVLRPLGRLIFCEHGLAPDPDVAAWQGRINPFWRPLTGGCNLNRDIPGLLDEGGFAVDDLETMYLPGTPRPMGFNYWGTARPR